RIVPVEADLAGLVLELERTREGRECDRHAGERACRLDAAFARFFLVLDALPELPDVLGAETARRAEHVRMAPQKLLADRLHDVAEIERALFLRHARVKDDLQQEVPQLLSQIAEAG